MSDRSILFLGGDARSRAMAMRMSVLGLRVMAYALGDFNAEDGVETCERLDEALDACRAVILPMPAFDTQLLLPCPYAPTLAPLHARELFSRMGGRVPAFGGRISPAVYAQAADCAVCLSDYTVSEEVQIRNAVPTAEGAIALAMQALDVTLHGSRVAVLGYGRIGHALAWRLRALGAQVTVGVRKRRDMARAEGEGCQTLHLLDSAQLQSLTRGYDVIFNTVPHRLLSDEMLAAMPRKTVLIELASSPGGWDANAPMACRCINGQGLPAKCAPRTAGELLANALFRQLEEGRRL